LEVQFVGVGVIAAPNLKPGDPYSMIYCCDADGKNGKVLHYTNELMLTLQWL
jgi:hypothetical protein